MSQNIRRPKPGDSVLYTARFVHCEDFPWGRLRPAPPLFPPQQPGCISIPRPVILITVLRAESVTNLVTLVECQDALLAGRGRFQRLLHPSSAATVQTFHA